jgi:hypothetical protein
MTMLAMISQNEKKKTGLSNPCTEIEALNAYLLFGDVRIFDRYCLVLLIMSTHSLINVATFT